MVLYRKYRPQNLKELLGQTQVQTALFNSYLNSRYSHAYLFCGPKGAGKTSTARILAKIINCEEVKDKKIEDLSKIPCNACSSCTSITDGTNLDLIEIDAASNRGIDDIRELRERIKLSPTGAHKKIYIIDEVHMLTTEAFNALLKTLEEPPEHVVFVLATTEAHKIPATILSRVQKFDFIQIPQNEIVETIKQVSEKEGFKITDEAAQELAKKADGSLRDALKYLDQLASSNSEISLDSVEGLLQSGLKESVKLCRLILENKTQESLDLFTTLSSQGINIKEFTHSVLSNLRALLIFKHSSKNNIDPVLAEVAASLSVQRVVEVIENFEKAFEKLKTSTILELPLEVAIIKSTTAFEQPVQVVVQPNTTSTEKKEAIPEESNISIVSSVDDIIPVKIDSNSTQDISMLKDKWIYILETIKPYNYSLEALLKQAIIKSCDGGDVILEVPYSFHQRILQAPKSRDLLESVIADVLGKSIKVSCVLGNRPVRIEEIANVELAQEDDIIKVAAEIFNS